MATVSAHLPDGSQLANDFFSHVEKHFGGKPGPFIKKLIEVFFEKNQSTPEATGENILVDLCERLRPESAEMLGEWLASQGVNQPRLLGKMLDALADTLLNDLTKNETYFEKAKGRDILVLMKVLPEDAHSVQAHYAFKKLPGSGEALVKLFDIDRNKSNMLADTLSANEKANKSKP